MPRSSRTVIRKLAALCLAVTLCLTIAPCAAQAAESGSSHYIQGTYGDFMMGYIPGAGFFARNDTIYQSGHMDSTFKAGQGFSRIDAVMVMNITKMSYMLDVPAMGGVLGFGAGVPFILNEHITGDVAVDLGRSRRTGRNSELNLGLDGDRGGLSDIFLMPVIAGWNFGECHLVVSPVIFLPTGYYNATKLTNLGMNYATFDGNVAFTWLSKSNIELSFNAGYMINTENKTAHYLTGNQLHVDWTAAYHVNERLALGAVGYLLAQTTPDSGTGATQGSYLSSGTGVGPVITYTVPVGGKDVMFIAKWLHGLGATNSLLGDTASIGVAIAF